MWRGLLVVLLAALVVAGGWLVWSLDQSLRVGSGEPFVQVRPGESPGQVLARLDREQQLLSYGLPLRAWLRLHDGTGMRPGEYALKPGMSARELIDQLLSGNARPDAFTLVEGWNFRQLREALDGDPRLPHLTAGLVDTAVMQQLGRDGLHPEGRFAPDTYFFLPGSSTDLEILARALKVQDERIAAAWDSRAPGLPYASAAQLLTMASIVEKETGVRRERAEIAGVFVRRLRQGMRLQTDPTVIYGMGAAYAGNITRADLLRPTAWNTYVIDGLPPTPIAMPGEEALQAAAHPADGDALYFVGKGDGSHRFSATLDEHNAAVREYQLQRRADYHSAPPSP